MRNLTATICLTFAVFLESGGVGYAQDIQKGLEAYHKGDYATALREWKPLAEHGDAKAQSYLGGMYQAGQGVTQDFEEAVKWIRQSAEQGDAEGQFSLGRMYDQGWGVTQDKVYAHMWMNIAASLGDALAVGYRDVIAKKMTPSQIEKAQELARECVRKNYKGC